MKYKIKIGRYSGKTLNQRKIYYKELKKQYKKKKINKETFEKYKKIINEI